MNNLFIFYYFLSSPHKTLAKFFAFVNFYLILLEKLSLTSLVYLIIT
nr:MAG TPA: hypothetical protein [Bacteriophage sp.]